jgi:hypothetical protein
MINNLTTTEQFVIIGQVFAKIAYNFWPVLVLGAIALVVIAYQESH